VTQPDTPGRETLAPPAKAHPWHGVSPGPNAPEILTAFIEIVPTDTVKYEIDKRSGYLKVDRPQQFSNICPSLYGFIPRTYCGRRVAELCIVRTGRSGIVGDRDPMDICVLTEKVIPRGDILVQAIPIGGFRMIDGDQADDKIIAVLQGDAVYGVLGEIAACPTPVIERLQHYFLTYKDAPGARSRRVEIAQVYGRDDAYDVIQRSRADYDELFGVGGPQDHG
jgi:inorganic pyrophosphatase